MKISIFSSFSLKGGGPRVALSIAKALSQERYTVTIFSYDTNPLTKEDQNFYSIDNLKNIEVIELRGFFGDFLKKRISEMYYSFLQSRKIVSLNTDLIIDVITNGLFWNSSKKKTIGYIHYPFEIRDKTNGSLFKRFIINSLVNSYIKKHLFEYNEIICNSFFTRNWIMEIYPETDPIVVSPPIETQKFQSLRKQNWITTIGRISPEKKIEVMIECFIDLYNKLKLNDLQFHIIGSTEERHKKYLFKLKKLIKDYPIFIHQDLSFSKMTEVLGKSKIYWHAKGYGETEKRLMEHFGISTVEAMASGCVPIVINKGGQCEIVKHEKNGYLWDAKEDLIGYTINVMNNKSLQKELSEKSILKSKEFGYDNFSRKIIDICKKLT